MPGQVAEAVPLPSSGCLLSVVSDPGRVMPSYRYQQGDRPLDGYTIEHPVGRGGFGEVYYAVSDAGRQVALKAVQNYEDIELRGISHCMNLKSAHLVSIFDVRHSDRGDPFVIMEYVSGPSLRELLDEAPEGLGPEKSAWLVREIARGLAVLHDNGIVHRDLKPHNVFVEDGTVKVGDYSLSKLITTSQRSGHTLTVGTVHYMAPEISLGRYDRAVDIYALGVMLFEMLTGQPPHTGESMGEVLMKHMSHAVDVSGLAEPFATVVRRSMAHDPAERYQSVDEMVDALFGADAVRDGVSGFSPQSLTVVARRAVRQAGADHPAGAASRNAQAETRAYRQRPGEGHAEQPPRAGQAWKSAVDEPWHRIADRLLVAGAVLPARYARLEPLSDDPLGRRSRFVLALLTMVAVTFGMAVADARPSAFLGYPLYQCVSLMTVGALASIWLRSLEWVTFRICSAVAALALGMMFTGFAPAFPDAEETVVAITLAMVVLDWRWLTSPVRLDRIRLEPCVFAGLAGLIGAALIRDGEPLFAFGIPAGAALAIQVFSPFDPLGADRIRGQGDWWSVFQEWLAERRNSAAGGPDSGAASASAERSSGLRSASGWWPEAAPTHAAIHPAGPESAGPGASNTADEARGPDAVAAAGAERTGTEISPREKLRRELLGLSLIPFLSLMVLPLCGLHRFRTGRVWTGLLWLCTLGLGLVGQLWDIVMITLGQFPSENGLLVTQWKHRHQTEQVNEFSGVPRISGLVNDALTALGGILLVVVILLGVMLAIDVPDLIKAGMFTGLNLERTDLQELLGTPTWDSLLWNMVALVAGVLSAGTVALLVLARRYESFWHIARIPLACVPLGVAFAMLQESFAYVTWDQAATALHGGQVGAFIQAVIRRGDQIALLTGVAVCFSLALTILAWPPSRSRGQRLPENRRTVREEQYQ